MIVAILAAALAWAQPLPVLENSAMRVTLRPTDGAVRVLDKATRVEWAIHPPVVTLKNKLEMPARPAGKVVVEGKTLRYAARLGIGHNPDFATPIEYDNLNDSKLGLEFHLRLQDSPPALDYSYSTAPGAEVRQVALLDKSLPLRQRGRDYYAAPHRMGVLFPVEGAQPYVRRLTPYGYSMAMFGAVKNGSALLITWDNPYTDIAIEYGVTPPELTAGIALREAARSIRLQPLGRGGYVEIAKAYREVARGRGFLKTMAEKIRENPNAERFLGAADFKPFAYIRRVPNTRWNPTSQELVSVNYTFRELGDLAEHLKRDVGIDRALLMLNGWINSGYDSRHPDVLPAAPPLGGNDALAECSRRVRAAGWLFGLHDNYMDMYKDAASFDEKLIVRNRDGSIRIGGVWYAGQAHIMCSRFAAQMASRPQNVPQVHRLFSPDVYFSDTVFAVSPMECFHPDHPATAVEGIENLKQLCRYIRKTVGMLGSEEGKEWGVPLADYFEGMMSHKTGFRVPATQRGDIVIPLFELVYGDAIPIYAHQSDRPRPDYPNHILDHILYAEMPVYYIGNHRYWEDPARDFQPPPDAGPRMVFARGEQFGLIDRFIRNTYEVLSPLGRATGLLPMTDHRFLTSDRKVEATRFGTDVEITVNYGSTPFQTERAVLPQYGFLVESPMLVAFHASRYRGLSYSDAPLFVIRSMDGKPIDSSSSVRVFHAFGDRRVEVRGKLVEVERETTLR
jgi:hypothetical protein